MKLIVNIALLSLIGGFAFGCCLIFFADGEPFLGSLELFAHVASMYLIHSIAKGEKK